MTRLFPGATPVLSPTAQSTGLHRSVVDALGTAITSTQLPAGTTLSTAQLCAEFAVSRSVLREALRTLESLGLVRTTPQVGTKVQPEGEWDLFSGYVISWRAASRYREQMMEVLEMRRGVESSAARLAAGRRSPEDAQMLLKTADQMKAALDAADEAGFLEADVLFHRTLLRASGNSMITKFTTVVDAALRSRPASQQPVFTHTTVAGIDLHLRLAQAVGDQKAALAESLARDIADLTASEF